VKLSRQLFLVSLLTLTLPWAGCQYVRQLDAQLLDTQAQALLDRAQAIAVQLESSPGLFAGLLPPPQLGGINFQNLDARPLLNGECTDWADAAGASNAVWKDLATSVRYMAGRVGSDLYLCVQVDDSQIQYHRPNLGELVFGDHLILYTGTQRYWLRAIEEGPFQGIYQLDSGAEALDYTLSGYWAERPQGYLVEVRIPDFVARGSLAIEVVENGIQTLASVGLNAQGRPLRYLQTNDGLQTAARELARADLEESIFLLSNTGSIAAAVLGEQAAQFNDPEDWLTKLYELLSAQNFVDNISYADQNGFFGREILQAAEAGPQVLWHRDGNRRLARAYYPLDIGGLRIAFLILDEPARILNDINSAALTRLLWYSGSAFAITSFGLIAYALWLSARIRRLSQATSELVQSRRGETVENVFVASDSKDELGELSRQYGEMLNRVSSYTGYLQSLSGKLSHEIRTPVAIVRSSLDNLEHAVEEADREKYLQRAREGIDRLSNILSSMSQSTAIESAIENAEREAFEPSVILRDLVAAYSELYPDISIGLKIDPKVESALVQGSADLYAQMLDKLVDNAADFCARGIHISLEKEGESLCMSVANDGPILPEEMAENLFDSLVSLRSEKSENPHLGLGLFVVKRVVEFHSGKIEARNLPDKTGVEFLIKMPAAF
tara:strand:+ start:110890 stop:112896 length:2007 start_codon:yes stop_codon:yes gene_type:complete